MAEWDFVCFGLVFGFVWCGVLIVVFFGCSLF